ncbi:MAG: hypothetical protein ACRDSR_02995 [Pseudonocardiaceae bacterium]
MLKQPPPEPDGPHRLPYGEQERCAVEGRRIDGSGQCAVVVIRDRMQRGWVLYPHGMADLGVLIADDAARTLADHIGGPSPRHGCPLAKCSRCWPASDPARTST